MSSVPVPNFVEPQISVNWVGAATRARTRNGTSDTRNRIIDKAWGDWTVFVDDDDTLDPRYIE